MSYEEKNESLNVIYENLFDFHKFQIFETKLSSLTRYQPICFDPKKYEKEKPLLVKNERGHDTEKNIQHKNFMRWRYSEEEDKVKAENCNDKIIGIKNMSKKYMESNSRIIEWSDGTFQLVIGDSYFDIMITDSLSTNLGVLDVENDIVVVGKPISKKMILRVNEDFSNDEDFIKLSNNLTSNNSKLSHNFYDTNQYIKEDNLNKYSRKTSKKEEDKDEFTKRKRSRP